MTDDTVSVGDRMWFSLPLLSQLEADPPDPLPLVVMEIRTLDDGSKLLVLSRATRNPPGAAAG